MKAQLSIPAALFLVLSCLIAPQFVSQAPPPQQTATGATGTVRGIVVREGTDETLSDVEIATMSQAEAAAGDTNALLEVLRAALGGALPSDAAEILQDRGQPAGPTVLTDAEGRFVLKNVPAGKAKLRVQLKGYFGPMTNGSYPSRAYSSADVTADKTTTVRLVLVPGGTISGRVLDTAGKPLSDAMIQILNDGYSNGARNLDITDVSRTDDRGEYRMFRLPPGAYYVAVSLPQLPGVPKKNSGAAPQESPVPTYYPNVTDPAFAQRLTLLPGGDLAGINVQMKTAPAVKVSGKVISAVMTGVATEGGQPRVGAVFLVPRDTRGTLSLGISNTVPVGVEGGDFEFQGVTPGTYDIIARLTAAMGNGWGPYNTPQTATHAWALGLATVDVRGADLSGVTVVVRTGVDIKGRLSLDGKTLRANARITLTPNDAFQNTGDQQVTLVMNQIRQYAAPIADDGTFVIPLVPEGRYRIQVAINPTATTATTAARGGVVRGGARGAPASAPPLPVDAYLSDIRQAGVSVYDNGLVVGHDEAPPLDVLLSTAKGSIEGSVRNADKTPVTGATVVLVPAENRRQNSALYKIIPSDAQGHFLIDNIAPGNYTVFAWESVIPGAYQNAEFLASFAGRGQTVVIQAGTRTVADLRAILK